MTNTGSNQVDLVDVLFPENEYRSNMEATTYESKTPSHVHAPKEFAEAFGLLVYPFYKTLPNYIKEHQIDDRCLARAVTCAANLEGTGFSLTAEAIVTLAAAYKFAYETLDGFQTDDPSAYALLGIDILDDIHGFYPTKEFPDPMYPDFPTQVMEMDEAQYRFHQILHYMSTYGVETIGTVLGIDTRVSKGWLPDVESTPKDKVVVDPDMPKPKMLNVALSVDEVKRVIVDRLSRKNRMTEEEIACVVMALEKVWIKASDISGKIAFKENMYELVYTKFSGTSSEIYSMLSATCQHATDLLKTVHYCLNKVKSATNKRHFATKQKKAFVKRLEDYDVSSLSENLADLPPELTNMLNYLSLERFLKNNETKMVIATYRNGNLKSYNSLLENLWGDYKETENEKIGEGILRLYKKRPGVLLRNLHRLHFSFEGSEHLLGMLEQVWNESCDSFSLPTLITTATVFMRKNFLNTNSAYFDTSAKPWIASKAGKHKFGFNREERLKDTRLQSQHRILAKKYILPAIKQKIRKLDVPFDHAKVYLDLSGFSAKGSLVLPNMVGDTGTYPPVGMAYNVPKEGRVRFFTFWDERREGRRVDIDLHFNGIRNDGTTVHIGWNGNYNANGMTTSGDITHSTDAVEYLDIDMATARRDGVNTVVENVVIYSGAKGFNDITTCYSGATMVGSIEKDVKLYSEENVLFRNDLTTLDSRRMNYALINVKENYCRILRGEDIDIQDSDFNLEQLLIILFGEHHCHIVENKDDADFVVYVGREGAEDADIVLVDEGFYCCK